MHVPCQLGSKRPDLVHTACIIRSFRFDLSHHPPPPPRCIRSMISECLFYVRAWITSLTNLRKLPLILSKLGESPVGQAGQALAF